MSDSEMPRKTVLTLVAAGAVAGALVLVLAAAFPYLYAESLRRVMRVSIARRRCSS
jgi:hypothetical protein